LDSVSILIITIFALTKCVYYDMFFLNIYNLCTLLHTRARARAHTHTHTHTHTHKSLKSLNIIKRIPSELFNLYDYDEYIYMKIFAHQ